MISDGITAGQLIAKLEQLAKQHGYDTQVFAGGEDYPSGVGGAALQTDSRNPYVPKGAIKIWTRG